MELRPTLLALSSPLPALLLGVWVMAAHGAAASRWGLQLAAAALALALAAFLSRAVRVRVAAAFAFAAVSIALTLALPGQEGVHRWISIGPLRLHAASLFLPLVLYAAAHAGRRLSLAVALVTLAALALQPDASQATAFGLAALALDREPPGRAFRAAVVAALVAFAWSRPDPLRPVDDVEGIVGLAWSMNPLLGLAAGVALLLPAAAHLMLAPRAASQSRLPVAFALYLPATVLATFAGAFPVPVMGFGVSPILGTWIALGLSLSTVEPIGQPHSSTSSS